MNNLSLWKGISGIQKFPELEGDISTDALVIGGGLAGIFIAYSLKSRGRDTVLVEKNRVMSGTSGNTTAKVTAQHGLVYHKLINSFGEEYAKKYLDANLGAVESIRRLCKEFDVSFYTKKNFVYSTEKEKLMAEIKALKSLGYSFEFCENIPVPAECLGAIGFCSQGQINPIELASKLTGDLKIYENTHVKEIKGTKALTNRGCISAKSIVVSTHFPFINKHGSYFLKLYQNRSYALALENAPLPEHMYVDDDSKGLSFSSFGDMLLLLGGAHRTGKKGGSYNELRRFKEKHFKDAKERYFWAAQDTMSLDKVPYVGRYSKSTPDLYVACGFNKWGLTSSMLSGEIIAALIMGESHEYAKVFDPSRSVLKPQLLVNGFESAKNLLTLTKRRCPHMGCALKYNKAEHSWDCACHGSRFSEDGKILDNPAN